MTRITLNHLDPDLERYIADRSARSGRSPDEVVMELLRRALEQKAGQDEPIGSRLDHLAGGWSVGDSQQFEAAVEVCEQIDEEMWR